MLRPGFRQRGRSDNRSAPHRRRGPVSVTEKTAGVPRFQISRPSNVRNCASPSVEKPENCLRLPVGLAPNRRDKTGLRGTTRSSFLRRVRSPCRVTLRQPEIARGVPRSSAGGQKGWDTHPVYLSILLSFQQHARKAHEYWRFLRSLPGSKPRAFSFWVCCRPPCCFSNIHN
jgi:hypothetical protein